MKIRNKIYLHQTQTVMISSVPNVCRNNIYIYIANSKFCGFFWSKQFPQIFAALNLMQYNVNNKVLEKDLPSKIRVTIRLCLENNNRFYLFLYGIAIYRKRSFAETFIDLRNLLLYLNKSYITFLRSL